MANLDTIFGALSDGTRRAVIERLTHGPASVSDLAAPHDMALPSFLKHLRVLEGAQLIISRKSGRVRVCELNPQSAQLAQSWLETQNSLWSARLDRLDAFVEALNEKENPS